MRRKHRKPGQALVEFALTVTLIFFLLSAAVDLGLIFMALQGMYNAQQEGATYGSRWTRTTAGVSTLDVAEIRERIRHESGDRGGIGFVNLLDLNNNGTPDDGESGVLESYIKVQAVADTDNDGNPEVNTGPADPSACSNLANVPNGIKCYIRIEMLYDYRPVFPLAPMLGETVQIRRVFLMLMRQTYRANG